MARLLAVVCVAGVLLSESTGQVAARESACRGDRPPVAARPVAPASLATSLPEPFALRPDRIDRAAVLREVADVVGDQARALGADACYIAKPTEIATRVDFLSPFEFLVVTMFEHDVQRRDALLDRYAGDPRAAIRELGTAFPSPRAQMILTTRAYYDLTADRIRVNAAGTPPDELRRVLVHEFWHAMPRARTWIERDGVPTRANGFWLQEQRGAGPIWLPIDDKRGLPYPPFLMDEAMVTLMETRFAGPQRFARPDLEDAQQFLARLMAVAGEREVIARFLESRPNDLVGLIELHRAQLPEPGIFSQR